MNYEALYFFMLPNGFSLVPYNRIIHINCDVLNQLHFQIKSNILFTKSRPCSELEVKNGSN